MGKLKMREELKQLQSLKDRLKGKINGLEIQQSQIRKELSALKNDLNTVNQKIASFSSKKELTMTEHAILRYFERVLKIDLDSFVQSITQDEALLTKVQQLGNGQYPVHDGEFKVVIKDNTIITIVVEDSNV